jgi:hypothetical protein
MRILSIIFLAFFSLCQFAQADSSIEQLMRFELASSQLSDGDETKDFSFPISGEISSKDYKSAERAGLFSLLLPGTGQYYIDKTSFKAKLFFGIESGMWLAYMGFRKYGVYKEDAAKGWAVVNAGAYAGNTDKEYWIRMTYYDNRDRNEDDGLGYNQMAAVYDRGDAVLFPETQNYYWNWNSRETRQRYRNLRNQSKTALERADIAVGIIIANHVVSAIEAYFAAGKHNRHLEFADTGIKLNCKLKSDPDNPTVTISLTKNFY